jgi:hypothetical protein
VEDANANAAPPADLAVWRPSSGTWWNQTTAGVPCYWGSSTDVPAPGDFDGDGRTDCAFYRASSTQFWVLTSSSGGYYTVTAGLAGDTPAVGDYDGDGKADVAVWRPSNLTF